MARQSSATLEGKPPILISVIKALEDTKVYIANLNAVSYEVNLIPDTKDCERIKRKLERMLREFG